MRILTIVFTLLSITCLSQDRFIKEQDIKSTHIKNGIVKYDTLEKGQGGVFRFIATDFGLVDTTKQIIIKYEAFQIDAAPAPIAQVDTVDSEGLTYTNWLKHGPILNPTLVPGWYKNTISYSTTGEAKYTFTGTGVQLYGEKLLSHGSGSVTVGAHSKTVSWSGSKQLPALIYDSGLLPQGQYTISIKPVSGVILIDFLIIQK